MTFKRVLGSLVLAVASASAAAQPADFTAKADSLVESAYPADGPGAAVVVARGGRIVYSAGRGLADVESRRPITPDTAFALGSIVKQLTAAIVLQLAAEGKISLDDPISRFFPDWPKPAAGATVRQLLNHSSGIQDFSKVPGWIAANRSRAWTTAELLALFRTLPARSKPGEAWEYNNGGYVMLGAIVEKVTGKAWHEAIEERIVRPLGLKTVAHAASGRALRTTARGHSEEGGRKVPLKTIPVTVAHASGGLVGSVLDLARWARALHRGGVVSPALYQEMIRPARLADGTTRPYGFGLRLQQLRGRPALVHGGAGAGLDTDSVYLPSDDLFVAVLANSDSPATDPAVLTRRLAALALSEPFPSFARAETDIAAIEPLFGLYRAETGPPLRFFARGARLFLGMGEGELEAFPAGGDRFFFGPDKLIWVRFVRRPGGAHLVEVNRPEEAQPLRAVRSGDAPPTFTVAPGVLRTYVGTYQTETLALAVALGEDGSLTATPAGQRPMPLRPVSETEFRIDGTPMRLVFHPENGRVDRLTLHRGARQLHGRRTGP